MSQETLTLIRYIVVFNYIKTNSCQTMEYNKLEKKDTTPSEFIPTEEELKVMEEDWIGDFFYDNELEKVRNTPSEKRALIFRLYRTIVYLRWASLSNETIVRTSRELFAIKERLEELLSENARDELEKRSIKLPSLQEMEVAYREDVAFRFVIYTRWELERNESTPSELTGLFMDFYRIIYHLLRHNSLGSVNWNDNRTLPHKLTDISSHFDFNDKFDEYRRNEYVMTLTLITLRLWKLLPEFTEYSKPQIVEGALDHFRDQMLS